MIQFILNNKTIKTKANSGVTLVDFIRDYQQLKGTKIGCREGDCGACTVLVGTLKNNTIRYQSITSCISPLGNANGKHIVTIEGINIPEKLNTVQQEMMQENATQCGFCTPGFVVSLTGFSLEKHTNSDQSCTDAISGNICRCTGYKSIEKAANTIATKVSYKEDNNSVQWLIDNHFIPDYFKEIPEKLKELSFSPLDKKGTLVANGTDLYVRHADSLSENNIHLLSEKSDLKGITFSKNSCTIGANTTVTDLFYHPILNNKIPRLKSFLKLVSSEQIRNMGTIAGNFVNASPIGDMSIFFLALESTLILQKRDKTERKISFAKFHTNYKVYDLQEDEIIKSIKFKLPESTTSFNFEKVSKRTHLDIASVNTAASIEIIGNTIQKAHISIGGVSAIPKYLFKTSAYLPNKQLTEKTLLEAEKIMQSEISPITDVRGTDTYKRFLAKQLFFAHFITLFPTKIQLQKLV